jgi:hypothetical protein
MVSHGPVRQVRPHTRIRRYLSQAAGAEGEQQQQQEEDDEGEEGEDKGTGMDARDEETFDDNDFYTQLLKEFVEQAGGAALAQGPKTKHRKLVDRKASKVRVPLPLLARG